MFNQSYDRDRYFNHVGDLYCNYCMCSLKSLPALIVVITQEFFHMSTNNLFELGLSFDGVLVGNHPDIAKDLSCKTVFLMALVLACRPSDLHRINATDYTKARNSLVFNVLLRNTILLLPIQVPHQNLNLNLNRFILVPI
jgi:hypothetical protein